MYSANLELVRPLYAGWGSGGWTAPITSQTNAVDFLART